MKDLLRQKRVLDSLKDYRRILEQEWIEKDKRMKEIEEKLEEEIDKQEMSYE